MKDISSTRRFTTAVVLALLLILADLGFNQLHATRAALSNIAFPFYWLVDTGARLGVWGGENLVSRTSLLKQNRQLREQELLLKGQLQQMLALRAENERLRKLFAARLTLPEDMQAAELIGIGPDPARHLVVLDKGKRDGVYVGQPVLDADGLMGQVIEVSSTSSRVLLVTDLTHAVPVRVIRNGVRAIVEGSGKQYQMNLRQVSFTTDIKVGDVLVTSGLGGRFPEGYPVGVVTALERDPGRAFVSARVRPKAQLDRSRHVLLAYRRG
ncbi:MAG: rod shape-determining protein MreC [Halieaceae bacterium]|nr:rod shape-determining protein MreC [Halieaceae bacterium]